MSIEDSASNDRMTKQSWDYRSAFLTKPQIDKLFQNKIDRAAAMLRAQEQFKRLVNED